MTNNVIRSLEIVLIYELQYLYQIIVNLNYEH